MPPAVSLPKAEKKARQKIYDARYYTKHRAQIILKRKARNSRTAVSSKDDEQNQLVSKADKSWDDSRQCEIGELTRKQQPDDPRLGYEPHFRKHDNAQIGMFFHEFKPKNKPIWGFNQVSAKCGKLVDTVRFE